MAEYIKANASQLTLGTANTLNDKFKLVNKLTNVNLDNDNHPNQVTEERYHNIFTYNSTTGSYYVLGVSAQYGLGSVLSLAVKDNTSIKFTDNAYTLGKNPIELVNYNTWIREQLKNNGQVVAELRPQYRQSGYVTLTSNYEPAFAAPLDPRFLTPSTSTMIDPKWWMTIHKKPTYLYAGMVVTVELTGELFIYKGIDICIKSDDPTTRAAIARKNWKRVSFEVEDIKSAGVVMPTVSAANVNSIQTHRIQSWNSPRALFMTTEDVLDSIGIMVATDYILMGCHYDMLEGNPSVQRKIMDRYSQPDKYIGLTIIPNLQGKNYSNYPNHSVSERVELQNVQGPLMLRTQHYNDKTKQFDKKAEIVMGYGGADMDLNAPGGSISLNTHDLYLNQVENIISERLALDTENIKLNNEKSIQAKTEMLTLEASSGIYMSAENETNVISGAFAVHTTGYSDLGDASSFLLSPVKFILSDKYVTAVDTAASAGSTSKSAQNYNVYNTASTTATRAPLQVAATDAVTSKKPTLSGAIANSILFNNVTTTNTYNFWRNENNAVDASMSWGAGSATENAIIPPKVTSNFGSIHAENLRIPKTVYQQLTDEIDAGRITMVDLTDRHGLLTPKPVNFISDAEEFKEAVSKELKAELQSTAKLPELSTLKMVNTREQLWVNNSTITYNDAELVDNSGNPVQYNNGYTIIGLNSGFSTEQANTLTDLINTGNITLEAFTDVSVFSHIGQVKLGREGFVRMNRQKKFVVQSADNSTYFRVTPDGIDIRAHGSHGKTKRAASSGSSILAGGVVNDELYDKGYIHLDTSILKLWEGFTFEHPFESETDKFLSFTIAKNGTSNALRWIDAPVIRGSVKKYGDDSSIQGDAETIDGTIKDQFSEDIILACPAKFYKVGTLQISTDYITTDAFVTNTLVGTRMPGGFTPVVTANLHCNISSWGFVGTFNVELMVMRYGNIMLQVTDNTTSYYNLQMYSTENNTTIPIVMPVAFDADWIFSSDIAGGIDAAKKRYAQVGLNKFGVKGETIDLDVYIPCAEMKFSDAHWNISLTSEYRNDEQGAVNWVPYHNNNNAQQGVDYDTINIKNPKRSANFATALADKTFYRTAMLSLIKPLHLFDAENLVGEEFNRISIPTYNIGDTKKTYLLKYTDAQGFGWSEDKQEEFKNALNTSTIETNNTLSSTIKWYLAGITEGGSGQQIVPDNVETLVVHNNIYYDSAGDIHASNFYQVSDQRLKDNIQNIETYERASLPALQQFTFKDTGKQGYGYIAQELEASGYPELVNTDDDGVKRVDYTSAYAIQFKQLMDRIERLEAEIEELKRR